MSGGHGERAHALLGASSASRWINCPPSARLTENIEDKKSTYSDEGESAHEYSELVIRRSVLPCNEMERKRLDKALKEHRESNQYYGQEMEDAVAWYVDEVYKRFKEAKERSADAVLLLEERLDYSEWVPDGFGTGDVVIISDGVLEIIDLKYGKGVPVSAVGNYQMKLYALGAWTAFDYLYDIKEVIMTIVQPRLDSVSSDSMSVVDLLGWANETVMPAAALADKGEGEFKAGEHCRWCKVKGSCRARADENMALLAHEFKAPALLSLEEIGPILTVAEHLQKWAKDVQEYAFQQAAKGNTVPGWKLVEGRSNRAIKDQEAAMLALAGAEDIGIEKYQKPPALLGIGDLEKNVGKKKLGELIGHLIVKPPGKPVLVVETDKREALGSLDGDFGGEEFDNE